MPVIPSAPKHTSQDLGDKLIISIPDLEKNWILVLFSWFWLVVLIGTALYIGVMIFDTPSPIIRMIAFLSILLMAILGFAVYRIVRDPTSKEIIEATAQNMKVGRTVFGRHSHNDFLAEHIKGLRVSSSNVSPRLLLWMNYYFSRLNRLQAGSLAFDYGAQTFRFGTSIDEAEAKQIIAELQQKFPQYKN